MLRRAARFVPSAQELFSGVVNNFFQFKTCNFLPAWYSIPMMNDMMPTIAETIDLNDIAQHEHEQWLRQSEREERWEAAEAIHGPLICK